MNDFDYSYIRIPFEEINRSFRNMQKNYSKEIIQIESEINSFYFLKDGNKNESTQEMIHSYNHEPYDILINRINNLLLMLEQAYEIHENKINGFIFRTKDILESIILKEQPAAKSSLFMGQKCSSAHESLLNRMIGNYMIQSGFNQSVECFKVESDVGYMNLDQELYLKTQEIYKSLKFSKNCSLALNWCHENGSKLRRLNSKFEIELRMQEFVELIRSKKHKEAIDYAQKYLSHEVRNNTERAKIALTALAIKDHQQTVLEEYHELFSLQRWSFLSDEFMHANQKVNSLTTAPSLLMALQTGLIVLNNPCCLKDDRRKESPSCPTCSWRCKELTYNLPLSQHNHSKLVCRQSQKLMDENNPPIVLPNGQVYSLYSVEEMISHSVNGGKIVCPSTGDDCDVNETQNAFII